MSKFWFVVSPALLLVLSLSVTPSSAQQGTGGPPPPDERARLAEIARTAAEQFATARAEGQTRPTEPITAQGPNIELTLDEATARALERNLDIAVERLNPQAQELNLARLSASYRPTLTSLFSTRSQVQPPTSQLNGGTIVSNDQMQYNAGVAQAIPWGGGNAQINWNNTRQETNNAFALLNPSFNSNFQASLTQPLLRGFLIDTTRQQLRVTAISRDISEVQLRGTIAATLANVRNAYWELVYALQSVDVARGSLDLAEKLLEDNRARVEVGTLAPLDVAQSDAEVATRRQALATAEGTLRSAEITLKRLIVSGTEDPYWRARLTPIDRPEFRPEPLDVEAAAQRALQERTDLQQARQQIESNDITLRLLRNQTLPALDLLANYQAQGVGGTQFVRQGLGGTVSDVIPGGYGDALRTLRNLSYPIWQVQLNVSYPIGASAAEANLARGRVQRNQAAAQLRALELQVAAEVTNAAVQVESSLTSYEAARVARELSELRLDAEQSRFDVGLSTNFLVVQAQRDLATAQNTELRALLNYRRALVDYERVQTAPAARGGGVTNVAAGGGF
jgi:outer membrane protein